MIRPEIRAALVRWQEALAGGSIVALGLYWALYTFGVLSWIGWLLVLGGAMLIAAGVQRARFRKGGGGPGVVQVVEGRINFFGPESGGLVDIETLAALEIDPTARPPSWILHRPMQEPVIIPLTAKGADALFDAFASLPGIRTEHMLRQMQEGGAHRVVIWRAENVRDAPIRLH